MRDMVSSFSISCPISTRDVQIKMIFYPEDLIVVKFLYEIACEQEEKHFIDFDLGSNISINLKYHNECLI